MNSGPNDVTIKLGLDDSQLPPPVQRVNAAIGSIGVAGQVSARQTAAAMRQLPAQFTDVATQLAGGQNPLLVLLQQGGQIKDSFGGIGPAIGGVMAAISPAVVGVGALAAAVGGVALAAVRGSAEAKQLADTVTLTGNAAGLTAVRLQVMSEQVAQATRSTVADSRQILLALAATGQVTNAALQPAAQAAARVAELSGENAAKVATDFATMAGGVAKWAAEHNRAWNFINAEQYRYIRGLEEQGKAEEAMIVVSNLVTESMRSQGQELGALQRFWREQTAAFDAFIESQKALGRNTLQDQLNSAREALGRAERVSGTPFLEYFLGTPEQARQRVQTIEAAILAAEREARRRGAQAGVARDEIEQERKREEEEARARGRAAQGENFIESLRSSTQREAAGLIADVRAKGEALIEIERQNDLQRLQQMKLQGDQRVQAVAAIKAKVAVARAALDDKIAKDTSKDPLGEFIGEKVLPEDKARQERIREQLINYSQQLLDANQRAGAELIEDERRRGEALIALDLQVARRRIEAQGESGGARDEALRLLDEQASLSRRRLEIDLRKSGDKLAEDTGKALYEDARSAISAAFRDSKNPLEAFGNALANIIFTRATTSLVDALATAAVGANGRGGGLGDLLSLVNTFAGGYGGSSTNPSASNYENSFDRMNPPKLATGTNYVPRNMLAMLHQGEAVVPARYNPAAGGAGAGVTIQYAPNISVDARSDQAQVASLVLSAVQEGNEALVEELQARGMLVS